jgi:hypothetical protein
MRETSIRRMKESSWSGGRKGEDKERPRERFGITIALGVSKIEMGLWAYEEWLNCSFKSPARNSQNVSFSTTVLMGGNRLILREDK